LYDITRWQRFVNNKTEHLFYYLILNPPRPPKNIYTYAYASTWDQLVYHLHCLLLNLKLPACFQEAHCHSTKHILYLTHHFSRKEHPSPDTSIHFCKNFGPPKHDVSLSHRPLPVYIHTRSHPHPPCCDQHHIRMSSGRTPAPSSPSSRDRSAFASAYRALSDRWTLLKLSYTSSRSVQKRKRGQLESAAAAIQ